VNTNSENQNRREIRPHNRLLAKKQVQRLIEGLCCEIRFFAKPENVNINLNYWAILTGLTLAIISIRLSSGLDFKQYGNVIATAISAVLISLILTPKILIKFNKQ
jgi:hypothetical protein